MDVLNNSDHSEEDDGMEEDDTEDTEDGEWDDYSLDSEQSDEWKVVNCLQTAISESQRLWYLYPVID